MESNGESKSTGIIQVKNWQVVLTLAAWFFMSILQFASVRAQTEQNSRDIEQMKQGTVTKEQYQELKEDILRRLQRIEDKLDREKMMRGIR